MVIFMNESKMSEHDESGILRMTADGLSELTRELCTKMQANSRSGDVYLMTNRFYVSFKVSLNEDDPEADPEVSPYSLVPEPYIDAMNFVGRKLRRGDHGTFFVPLMRDIKDTFENDEVIAVKYGIESLFPVQIFGTDHDLFGKPYD
jgi:hypothetical protein